MKTFCPNLHLCTEEGAKLLTIIGDCTCLSMLLTEQSRRQRASLSKWPKRARPNKVTNSWLWFFYVHTAKSRQKNTHINWFEKSVSIKLQNVLLTPKYTSKRFTYIPTYLLTYFAYSNNIYVLCIITYVFSSTYFDPAN